MRFCKGKGWAKTLGCDLQRKTQPLLFTDTESHCTGKLLYNYCIKVVEGGPAHGQVTHAISLQGSDRHCLHKHQSGREGRGFGHPLDYSDASLQDFFEIHWRSLCWNPQAKHGVSGEGQILGLLVKHVVAHTPKHHRKRITLICQSTDNKVWGWDSNFIMKKQKEKRKKLRKCLDNFVLVFGSFWFRL